MLLYFHQLVALVANCMRLQFGAEHKVLSGFLELFPWKQLPAVAKWHFDSTENEPSSEGGVWTAKQLTKKSNQAAGSSDKSV